MAGLVTAAGHGKNLLVFISGHGAFELTAIVISGAAGMVMGYALVDARGRTRFGSLRAKAKDVAVLAMGAALMLLAAAMYWTLVNVVRIGFDQFDRVLNRHLTADEKRQRTRVAAQPQALRERWTRLNTSRTEQVP